MATSRSAIPAADGFAQREGEVRNHGRGSGLLQRQVPDVHKVGRQPRVPADIYFQLLLPSCARAPVVLETLEHVDVSLDERILPATHVADGNFHLRALAVHVERPGFLVAVAEAGARSR